MKSKSSSVTIENVPKTGWQTNALETRMSEGTDIQIPCDGKMINFEEDEEDQHRDTKREAVQRISAGALRPNTCQRRRGGGSPATQGEQSTKRRPQIPEIGTANKVSQ